MDSERFGSVMCALGQFREREKAAPAERSAGADDDGDAAGGELICGDAALDDDDDGEAAADGPWQPPRAPGARA